MLKLCAFPENTIHHHCHSNNQAQPLRKVENLDLNKKEPECKVFGFWGFFFVFLPFLCLLPWHVEVPRLGVESEL